MPESLIGRLALGLALSAAIAGAGVWRRALTWSGAAGALVSGTIVFGLGGLAWAVPMVALFVSGSALSALGRERKRALGEVAAKGARRDLMQVLANGGAATALALAAGSAGLATSLFPAYLGVLAAVTADTWSTEIGGLSRRPPRLVTTLAVVPPGTAGGVTPLGLLAATAGGLWIGAVGWLSLLLEGGPAAIGLGAALALGALAGLAGSLVDSVLGATVQEVRWCPACQAATEAAVHRCGAPSLPHRGWPGLTNDAVNFLASLIGIPVGLSVAMLA
ncbi:DUF92 domain-containing protein [Thermomicrobiaceae bacterium CFH 74404]|uniref:DUF92 domain-containing protein n=1 Tax=Thermalbibacter longus TaxID=2951981 RepID=A0AA41WH66_9BACT|nr:DUF92 domain-containing protein [Thermalbibacter longus]MCM8749960.1 DUF92 domain-containing protein [Thermalbibacter longus]